MRALNLFFFLFLLLFSCNNSDSEAIVPFFKDLEKGTSQNKLFDLFKTSELEAFLTNEELYYELFVPTLNETARNHEFEIKSFLNEHGLTELSEEAKVFLILLFQKYLNNSNLDEVENLKLSKEIIEKRNLEAYYLEELYSYKIDEIVESYSKYYNIGDSITLILPMDYSNKYNEWKVYLNPFPASLDYSNASDTIFLKGIVLNLNNQQSEENSLIVQIKLIENSHPDVFVFDDYYTSSDTFSIDIRDYAHPPFDL